MRLQLLACALSTEESDEWDCGWCCVVNKERHHPHATSTVVEDEKASVWIGDQGNGGWRTRFGSDQAPCLNWPISIHSIPARKTAPHEGNCATHSFFPFGLVRPPSTTSPQQVSHASRPRGTSAL